LIFATYDYSVLVGAVYVEEVLFASLALTIKDYSLFSNMVYLVFEFGVYDIWLLEIMLHCIALHCITWHLELCREPMVATVPV